MVRAAKVDRKSSRRKELHSFQIKREAVVFCWNFQEALRLILSLRRARSNEQYGPDQRQPISRSLTLRALHRGTLL